MSEYTWTVTFNELYLKASAFYKDGKHDSQTYFSNEEKAFLRSIGCTSQELYDFVEDWLTAGEPDYSTCLLITAVRRSYFQKILKSQLSDKQVDPSTLPPKNAELDGIIWLPRIIEKARIKLRGEMHPDLMYGCGGDRKFFKTNNLHAADFLLAVWEAGDNIESILKFVKSPRD